MRIIVGCSCMIGGLRERKSEHVHLHEGALVDNLLQHLIANDGSAGAVLMQLLPIIDRQQPSRVDPLQDRVEGFFLRPIVGA